MKPIIGILARKDKLKSGNKILYIYEDIETKIKEANAIPIGIDIENIENTISIINGLIIQGGDTYEEKEIDIIKEVYKKDIPTLGICLGMQLMALATGAKLIRINNHMNPKKYHEIKIKKESKLYKIIKKEKTIVNTRHNYAIKNATLNVSAQADNIIEAIEDPQKKFFIGLQWHPETLNNDDTKNIFKSFIESVKK